MTNAELKAYRQLALARFEQLLLELPNRPHDADDLVDYSIRELSGLPSRPYNKPPYVGLYGKSTLKNYRKAGGQRLHDLVLKQPDITPIDHNIDTAIRRLSSLPDRPPHVAPLCQVICAAR